MKTILLLAWVLGCFFCRAQPDDYLMPYEFPSLGDNNFADLFSDNTTKTLDFSRYEQPPAHKIIVKGYYDINVISIHPILEITKPDGTKIQLRPIKIGYSTFYYTLNIGDKETGTLTVKLKLTANQDHIHIEFYQLMSRANI